MDGQTNIYLRLTDYSNNALNTSGKQVASNGAVKGTIDANNTQFIRLSDFSTDIEQTLNIGSQSTGAGAGRVTFNPFTIRKPIDATSPTLFTNAASGTPFKTAELFVANAKGIILLVFTFKLVAVKTVSWSVSAGDEGVSEVVTFEYGGLFVTVNGQGPDGNINNTTLAGWNRVRNVKDSDINSMIQ